MHIPPFLRILLHHLPDSGYARCQYIYFLFGLLTMIFHSVRRVGFHLYMAVSTLQLTSIRNLSEYWQLLLKHTSRCRSIFGFHILLSDTAVESCVTFKPRKAPIQLIQFSMFKIVARRIELRQTKPCQCISKLQPLLCKGFSVSNNATTIHTSPIDRNYCSSARLSGDKDKRSV